MCIRDRMMPTAEELSRPSKLVMMPPVNMAETISTSSQGMRLSASLKAVSYTHLLYECDFEANAALLHQFIYENNA